MIILITMRNSADKRGESPKKTSLFSKVLVTTALDSTLASCWGELNEINFDSDDNSVNFEMAFNWWEYVHYDVTIRKDGDSTYCWLVNGGYFKSKKFEWTTPERVFEEVTDEICGNVSEAQLSSRDHIHELEIKAQNKIKFIEQEYKKMLDENDWGVKDSTIVYKP